MSNGGHEDRKEDELDDGPEFHGTEEELEKLREAEARVLARENAATQEQINRLNVELKSIDADYKMPLLEQVQSEPFEDPLSGVRRQDGADQLARKEKKVKDVLDKNSSGDKEKEEEKKKKNTRKYLLMFGLIVSGAITGIVMAALKRKADDEDDDDLPLPDAVKQQIEALVRSWKDLPEDQYWAQMANYAQTNNETLADLIYFMQYTKILSPLKAPWLWNSSTDKDDYADRLIDAYQSHGIAALFNLVATLRYQREGEPAPEALPRYIGADLAQLALGELASPNP
jgi:hypothetical protein